ncbi:hypothetical protein LTR53_017208 [Teratosphaeriaceae sp. CCFEE 6253]|nr:hypothetical protein LTR53_017208 [Teratosphaeriaceae sp. CCFEE 6253]
MPFPFSTSMMSLLSANYTNSYDDPANPYEYSDETSDSDVTMVDLPPSASSDTLTPDPLHATIPYPPSTASSNPPSDLAALPPDDRQTYYHTLFAHPVPIAHLHRPLLADAYPALADEIHTAYLQHTTFVFRVLVNYDAGAQRFYTSLPRGRNGARYADCGKWVFTCKTLENLRRADADQMVFARVRLDVGTHFTPLAQLTLEVWRPSQPSSLDAGGAPRVDVFVHPLAHHDPRALRFVTAQARVIADADRDYTGGKAGFSLDDLWKIAALFRREQSAFEARAVAGYGYNGDWEGGGQNRNTGYMEWPDEYV